MVAGKEEERRRRIRRMKSKLTCCHDCYMETLKKIPIVGEVFREGRLSGIIIVYICRKHKIQRLRDDIKDWKRQIEWTREKIEKLIIGKEKEECQLV